MKKLIIAFGLLVLIGISSCGGDDYTEIEMQIETPASGSSDPGDGNEGGEGEGSGGPG